MGVYNPQYSLPPGTPIDANLVRESKVHFDILCERYPKAEIVLLRVAADGAITAEVQATNWHIAKRERWAWLSE